MSAGSGLALLHRRLAVAMALVALTAFVAGAGLAPVLVIPAVAGLTVALVWQPSPQLAARLEPVWLAGAVLVAFRAFLFVLEGGGDVVIPVVDLLLLLLVAEALRPDETWNDVRIYALSFALVLGATAYRPGLVFGVSFALYIVFTTLSLVVGHLRRMAGPAADRAGVVSRSTLLGTAGLSLGVLLSSVLVFLFFPRVSQAGPGRGDLSATSIVGFSDRVSLGDHGGSIRPNPQIVLRVEFPEGRIEPASGLYWRGRSYDYFDGTTWSRRRTPPSQPPSSWYRERWEGPRVVQRIQGAPLAERVLFALHPALDVVAESGISPVQTSAGDLVYWGRDAPVYEAVSILGRPSPSSLREAGGSFVPGGGRFLQLPPGTERIRALADSLTAGLESPFDRTETIERWLRTELAYTLELPGSAREATLEHFLFRRREGHCEYFSTAMVVMLRTLGIPAREVNGFAGGRWNEFGDYLVVTQNEAHSWVEVWFPSFGWVPFDPTPGGGASAAAASTTWSWPGRFLFDGLQYRWSTWILQYSGRAQVDALTWLRQFFGGGPDEEGPAAGEDGASGPLLPIAGLGLLFLLVASLLLHRRERASLSWESRLFERLRALCRRRGLGDAGRLAPLELVEKLHAERWRGAEAAETMVRLYLRARWGEEDAASPVGRPALRTAWSEARRGLRPPAASH